MLRSHPECARGWLLNYVVRDWHVCWCQIRLKYPLYFLVRLGGGKLVQSRFQSPTNRGFLMRILFCNCTESPVMPLRSPRKMRATVENMSSLLLIKVKVSPTGKRLFKSDAIERFARLHHTADRLSELTGSLALRA